MTQVTPAIYQQAGTKQRWRQALRTHLVALGFLTPSLIFLGVFIFYPLVKTVYYSFFLTNALGEPVKFVGFANYTTILKDPVFLTSLGVTLIFVVAVTSLTTICALALANLARKHLRGTVIFRTLFASTMGVQCQWHQFYGYSSFNQPLAYLT